MSAAFLDAVHADPWAESFLDLPSLNASASDAIEAGVRRVREVARSEPHGLRSSSLVVLGPPGAGKTHLFARLRRKLGPRAVFVHVRPLVHMEMTPRFVLGEIVTQLAYGTHGVSALPQVHAMVGSLLAHLSGRAAFFPSAFLADCAAMDDAERDARLDATIEQVLGIWQEVDEGYLRRLLQVPFAKSPAVRRSLLSWLSGRDCDVSQLARIGATAPLAEELSGPALRTLAVVAALGAPIVLVFDQLENLVDREGPGSRLLAYANLTAELVDSMRGLVLVHMALDTEWSRGIEPALNLSQRSRLLMARETLALPTTKQREELLELWIAALPERPAAAGWPISDARMQELCVRPGVTPRMLLVEFRRALSGEALEARAPESEPREKTISATGAEDEPAERASLLAEWEDRLAAARAAAQRASEERAPLDPLRLADGLLACSGFLEGRTLAPLKGADAGQLRLSTPGGSARLVLLQQSSPKSLGAGLKKLASVAEREPVVVVRERARELSPTWKDTLAKRSALLATGRARWVWLDHDDAVALLALESLLQSARSGDLADERGTPLGEGAVSDWIAATLDVRRWNVVRAILADAGAETDEGGERAGEEARPRVESGSAAAPAATGTAMALLRRLRIASLDRVVREVTRTDPHATRASVIAELERSSNEVRWFGRTILAVRLA